MTESFFELIMGSMSLFGLFGLLVAILSSFETDEREEIIVDIMVNILLIVIGSIYSNFALFRSLHQVASYL